MKLPDIPHINVVTEKEFVEHFKEDDFLLKYGNPILVVANNGQCAVLMAIEYYERLTGEKVVIEDTGVAQP